VGCGLVLYCFRLSFALCRANSKKSVPEKRRRVRQSTWLTVASSGPRITYSNGVRCETTASKQAGTAAERRSAAAAAGLL